MKNRSVLFKSLAWILALVLILIIAFFIYYYLELNYDERVTEHLTEDVIVINDLIVSMYLVKTDSGYIAVDTGFFNAFLEKGLEYNHINKNDIKYVLVTHSDADHINGLKIFSKAKVYFPLKERKMLDIKKQRFTFLPFYSNNFNAARYALVENNAELKLLNRKIMCISLPGHTYGSMGYLIDNKYLFSGDAFRIKNGKIDMPFKKQFVMDIDQMKNTLSKVASLDSIRYIFSSHSGFTADFRFAVSDLNK